MSPRATGDIHVESARIETSDRYLTRRAREDWIIENRSQEVHAFHIHQARFLLLEWYGAVNELSLRDTINVPFWDGKSTTYPLVKVRVDFRDPNILSTCVCRCHVLEHEDTMGLILVELATGAAAQPPKESARPERSF
jgi:FtsP/CotA-like multicopper oxidase with cupredoxin domain